MTNTWFTSDQHYYHKNICRFAGRDFESVEKMNRALIENHNACVGTNDIVYHLGDFAFARIEQIESILRQLSGAEHRLIVGNHEKEIMKNEQRLLDGGFFKSIDHYKEITIAGQKIILCHYAFSVWNKSHYGSHNYYGHSHSNHENYRIGKQMDCGVDNAFKLLGSYRPFSFKETNRFMEKREVGIVDHHGKK